MDTTQIVLDTLALLPSDFNLSLEVKKAVNSALSTQFFQGGALLAILGGIVMNLKGIFRWIMERVNRNIRYSVYVNSNDTALYTAVKDWLHQNRPQSFRNVEAKIKFNDLEDDIDKKVALTLFQYNDVNIIWYNRRILMISKDRETLENSSSIYNRFLDSYTISGLFSKKAITKFLKECIQISKENLKKEKLESGITIYYNSYGEWFSKKIMNIKSFDHIFFKQKNELINDLEMFKSNSAYYKKLGLNSKRGYLFSGPPGNGKSASCMAVGSYLDKNLYYLNLASISSDTNLTNLVSEIRDNSVIIFEDIDVLLTNTKQSRSANTKDSAGVSFSGLLNVMSGAFEPDNCIMILTTNHPERLDGALIRAGRVDKHIKITNPTVSVAIEFLHDFYSNENFILENEEEETMLDTHLLVPMSEIQDKCLQNINEPEKVWKWILTQKETK